MKVRRFTLAITALLVMLATVFGVSPSNVMAQSVCSPATAISVPFAKDGAGDFCYQTANLCTFINSWNMTTLQINGVNYNNIYVFSNTIAPLNGTYTIHYVGPYAWSHFEIGGPCSSGPTNTPTRTNTPSGPTFTPSRTATRTNTPTGPTFTP